MLHRFPCYAFISTFFFSRVLQGDLGEFRMYLWWTPYLGWFKFRSHRVSTSGKPPFSAPLKCPKIKIVAKKEKKNGTKHFHVIRHRNSYCCRSRCIFFYVHLWFCLYLASCKCLLTSGPLRHLWPLLWAPALCCIAT